MKSKLLALFAALLILGCCAPQTVETPAEEVSALVERTVRIDVNCVGLKGGGSGVLLEGDSDRLVVATAEHVVVHNERPCVLTVVRDSGERHLVFRTQVNAKRDVAVLTTLDGVPEALPPLVLRQAVLGEPILSTGHPTDRLRGKQLLTVSRGTLSVVYKDAPGKHSFRVSLSLHPGYSGGPCWGLDGSLLGLTVSGFLDHSSRHSPIFVTAAEHIQDLLDR